MPLVEQIRQIIQQVAVELARRDKSLYGEAIGRVSCDEKRCEEGERAPGELC